MDPLINLIDPALGLRVKSSMRPAAASSPGLAALARQAGKGGVEQTGTTRTLKAVGDIQVDTDPSGKYWLDPQSGKWRVIGELPPGYVPKPIK